MSATVCREERRRILLSWSGGKDAALSLLRLQTEHDVVGLWTVITSTREEVTSHGTPLWAIEAQARALGLPLVTTSVPPSPTNEVWIERCRTSLDEARTSLDCNALAFGDIHLEDIRRFREAHLSDPRQPLIFPLWDEPPARLAREALDRGIRARIVSTREDLSLSSAGSPWDHAWIAQHPHLDPMGENGEIHTFVEAMPGFSQRVEARISEGRRSAEGYVQVVWER